MQRGSSITAGWGIQESTWVFRVVHGKVFIGAIHLHFDAKSEKGSLWPEHRKYSTGHESTANSLRHKVHTLRISDAEIFSFVYVAPKRMFAVLISWQSWKWMTHFWLTAGQGTYTHRHLFCLTVQFGINYMVNGGLNPFKNTDQICLPHHFYLRTRMNHLLTNGGAIRHHRCGHHCHLKVYHNYGIYPPGEHLLVLNKNCQKCSVVCLCWLLPSRCVPLCPKHP